jgi:ubiquinone/menaquinone biosynthesis C-methylase UbiE
MSGKFFDVLTWILRQVAYALHMRKFYNNKLYQIISRKAEKIQVTNWRFMNYGFEYLDGEERPVLQEEDEPDRYCIQLYNQVFNGVCIEGKKVLEVSSGRGGGSYFIKHYLKPECVTGLDLSQTMVEHCKRTYKEDGSNFIEGDADNLPFEPNSFDAVVNIEASNGYNSLSIFFNQVYRVLKPNGHFFFADLRFTNGQLQKLNHCLESSPFQIITKKDITLNVLEALKKDNERKLRLIKHKVPRFYSNAFKNFAAMEGSRMFEKFENGEIVYLSCVSRKADEGNTKMA